MSHWQKNQSPKLDTNISVSLQCSSTHESAHILSDNPKEAGDKAEISKRGGRGKFGASDAEEEKDTLQLLSLGGPRIEAKSKAKCDHYRNDLLKQIEEKKRLKQLQVDREKAADEELQNRVAQQRLAMYMEYLEERKRGDSIVKAKTAIGGAPEPTKRLPFKGGHPTLFDLPEGHSPSTSQAASVFAKGTCRPKAQSDESPVPGKGIYSRRTISRLIGQ